MHKLSAIGIILPSLLIASAGADLYLDDPFDAYGQDNLDIVSVDVNDNGSDLFITLEVTNLNADWGKYMLFFDLFENQGTGDNHNPWARNVAGMTGTDAFTGSYIDNGGGTLMYQYGSSWNLTADSNFPGLSLLAPVVDYGSNTITWNSYGLVDYLQGDFDLDGFNFNVGTTGGNQGDPAIDLLVGSGANWGGQANSGGEWAYYEFSTVPAPGALALLGMAGIATRRRR